MKRFLFFLLLVAIGIAALRFAIDDDVIAQDDHVIWTLESSDFAPDGLCGLLNFLAAYHHQVARLREVSLE